MKKKAKFQRLSLSQPKCHRSDHTAKCAAHASLPFSQNNASTHIRTRTNMHLCVFHWSDGDKWSAEAAECHFKVVCVLKQSGSKGLC